MEYVYGQNTRGMLLPERQKYSQKNLSRCHFVHHKLHMS